MFKLALIAFGLLNVSVSALATTGFETGNEFQAVELRGNITVTCPSRFGGGYVTSYFSCVGDTLDPVEFARFRTDAPVAADAVELRAIHEDGSSRTKAGSYSSSKSTSERFNLWIRTLTQRPLLEMGKNTIGYTMKKNGAVVANGTFIANVNDGGVRRCQNDSYWSQNPADCEGGSYACDYLFRNQNYCQ